MGWSQSRKGLALWVEAIRLVGDKTCTECRHDLGSVIEVAHFAEAVRGHGSIENQQHGVLDMQFGEDAHRARKDLSAENLA
jgi:hypothetical protein